MSDVAREPARLSAESLAVPVVDRAPWTNTLFRRRRYLVHRRYQLRVTTVVVGTTFVLLLLVNLTLYAANQRAALAPVRLAPELQPYFEVQNRFQMDLIALGSLGFLVGVFLLGILETHRTAGASLNLCRCLDQLRDGRYTVRARLRRSDNLKEIEQSLNELAFGLQEKARRDVAILDQLADRAERIGDPEARALALEARNLASEKRSLVG